VKYRDISIYISIGGNEFLWNNSGAINEIRWGLSPGESVVKTVIPIKLLQVTLVVRFGGCTAICNSRRRCRGEGE
jgi:hypothetical protein